jgi:hypothetical protein
VDPEVAQDAATKAYADYVGITLVPNVAALDATFGGIGNWIKVAEATSLGASTGVTALNGLFGTFLVRNDINYEADFDQHQRQTLYAEHPTLGARVIERFRNQTGFAWGAWSAWRDMTPTSSYSGGYGKVVRYDPDLGTFTVETPTLSSHVATKAYVDDRQVMFITSSANLDALSFPAAYGKVSLGDLAAYTGLAEMGTGNGTFLFENHVTFLAGPAYAQRQVLYSNSDGTGPLRVAERTRTRPPASAWGAWSAWAIVPTAVKASSAEVQAMTEDTKFITPAGLSAAAPATAVGDRLVRRESTGQVRVPNTPVNSGHAASKIYVDGRASPLIQSVADLNAYTSRFGQWARVVIGSADIDFGIPALGDAYGTALVENHEMYQSYTGSQMAQRQIVHLETPSLGPVKIQRTRVETAFVYGAWSAWTLVPGTYVAVPATATSAGVAGTQAYDASYLYVCIATNTWKRTALATW